MSLSQSDLQKLTCETAIKAVYAGAALILRRHAEIISKRNQVQGGNADFQRGADAAFAVVVQALREAADELENKSELRFDLNRPDAATHG